MSSNGRPQTLDQDKKSQILDILETGCSRATAAAAVNCHPLTLARAAKRDPAFADQLAAAENKSEIVHLENLRKAGSLPNYWRASAWLLERISPDRYAKPDPNSVTPAEMKSLVAQIAKIIVQEIPIAEYRKQILKRFHALLKETRYLKPFLPDSAHDDPLLEQPLTSAPAHPSADQFSDLRGTGILPVTENLTDPAGTTAPAVD